jgi:hypothetical protein
MPALDWQFILVTLVALTALGVLVRRLVPGRKVGGAAKSDPACAHCASNAERRPDTAARAPRTTTTPVVSLMDLRETAHRDRPRGSEEQRFSG